MVVMVVWRLRESGHKADSSKSDRLFSYRSVTRSSRVAYGGIFLSGRSERPVD